MQIANVMVALGGDTGTTVPKYGITVSEIEVLRAIHGNAAVQEIEPLGDIERSDREEISRLREIYGRATMDGPNGKIGIVSHLFPGAAAPAFKSFDQLEIDQSFFKAEKRMVAPAAPKKSSKKAAPAPEPETASGTEGGADSQTLFE